MLNATWYAYCKLGGPRVFVGREPAQRRAGDGSSDSCTSREHRRVLVRDLRKPPAPAYAIGARRLWLLTTPHVLLDQSKAKEKHKRGWLVRTPFREWDPHPRLYRGNFQKVSFFVRPIRISERESSKRLSGLIHCQFKQVLPSRHRQLRRRPQSLAHCTMTVKNLRNEGFRTVHEGCKLVF
jgi:hypothetical protein